MIQGELQLALSVQPFNHADLRENERDLKNRKRFGWTDDDDTADWPHAAGVYRRIESANRGRRDERHARLERSQSSRLGCHSLPRNMSNRRYLPRSLFPLHKQLDRQREVQRSIKFAENATPQIWFVRKRVRISFQENESIRLGEPTC